MSASMPLPANHNRSRIFVLVHGAWHGAWCWQRVVDILVARGHRVITPTLTGLGERAHEMSREIDLDTHICDVVNVFQDESISNVVLCAHSYAGWVASGAVEYVHSQVSTLVFLDAHLPQDGERGIDTSNHRREIEIALKNHQTSTSPPSASEFGLVGDDRAWVDAMMTPQPIGVALQPIRLSGARERIKNKVYIRALGYPSKRFDAYRDSAREAGWQVYEMQCGHDMMIQEPGQLSDLLIKSASA